MARPILPLIHSRAESGWRSSGGFELFLTHQRTAVLTLGADVTVYELDHGDRRSIRRADAGLNDTGVAAVAVRITRSEHVEELGQLCIVHQPRLGEVAVRQAAALGERHQLF